MKYPDTWEQQIKELLHSGSARLTDGPQPLSMGSNLQAAFYILVYGCVSALASFAAEVLIRCIGVVASFVLETLCLGPALRFRQLKSRSLWNSQQAWVTMR